MKIAVKVQQHNSTTKVLSISFCCIVRLIQKCHSFVFYFGTESKWVIKETPIFTIDILEIRKVKLIFIVFQV